MRKFQPFLTWCIAAAALALASLVIVSFGPDYTDPASRHGLFHAWFYLLPILADGLVWPEGPVLMLALAFAVYVLQYLALIALMSGSWAAAQVLVDFFSPPKHRRLILRKRWLE